MRTTPINPVVKSDDFIFNKIFATKYKNMKSDNKFVVGFT